MHAKQLWMIGLSWMLGCAAVEDGEGAPLPPLSASALSDAGTTPSTEAGSPTSSPDSSAPVTADVDASLPAGGDAAVSVSDASNPRPATGAGGPELCDNGWDDDLDGLVDENCACNGSTTKACHFGPNDSSGNVCPQGVQTCASTSEFSFWGPCVSTGAPPPKDLCACIPETCDNQKDDNCNGQVDEGCAVEVPVNINGDCVTASCPAWAPYPVGCDLMMEGGDSRGCVANAPGSPEVYFQEGDACPIFGGILGGLEGDVGHISGKLLCSSQKGAALDATRCMLNKKEKIFPADKSGCP
jgi:hypothetical protein